MTRAARVAAEVSLAVVSLGVAGPAAAQHAARRGPERGYVAVDGLQMAYDVRGPVRPGRGVGLGDTPPVVFLHGAVADVASSFGGIRARLARTRPTIGLAQQGHGGTRDVDRPLRYERMADNTADAVRRLHTGPVDLVGWSDGGRVALRLAAMHPELVRKVVLVGTSYRKDGEDASLLAFLETATPNDWPAEVRQLYARTAADPARFPVVAAKLTRLWLDFAGWSPDVLRSIAAPVLVVIGDHDAVRPEHALEMVHLLPHAELAVLPGTDHMAPVQRPAWLAPMIEEFFAAPMPPATPAAGTPPAR